MNPKAGAGRGNSPTLEEVRAVIDRVDLQSSSFWANVQNWCALEN